MAAVLIFFILTCCTPKTPSSETVSDKDNKDKEKKAQGPLNILVI